MRDYGLPDIIILPPDAGPNDDRIEIDGPGQEIRVYQNGLLVGRWNSDEFSIGDIENLGRRVTLSPLGNIRIRDSDDTLVVEISEHGFTLRDTTNGLIVAEIRPGLIRIVDPNGTDDIEMVTSSAGTLPNPVYRSEPEDAPGSSIVAPTFPTFTTPITDLEIDHAAAWIRGTNQAASMTPPASHTERSDVVVQDTAGTLQTSVATLQPAVAGAHTFTSSQSNWDHAIGTHVIISGGGPSAPSFRSIQTTNVVTSDDSATITADAPTGLADTDALVALVTLGVNGGFLPTDWTVPEGFIPLGYNIAFSGAGAAMSTLATGAWVKRAGASEPSSYSVTIELPTGTKVISVSLIAIQNAFLIPGGVQIRLAGRPIRRELARQVLSAASRTICDFQNISEAYDNLEIVLDGIASNTGAADQQLFMRFNNDSGNNYAYRTTRDAAPVNSGVGQPSIRLGGLSGTGGSRTSGRVNIIGYKSSDKPTAISDIWWTSGVVPHDERDSGQWDGDGTTSVINRIAITAVDAGGGIPTFAADSRAILYGY